MKNGNPGRGLALTSMVLGILGIVLSFCLGFGILLAIPGLIFGIIGLVKKQGGMAIAGLILSIIALAISFVIVKPADTNQMTNQQTTSTTTQQSQTAEDKNKKMNTVLVIL